MSAAAGERRPLPATSPRTTGVCMVLHSFYPHVGGAERQLQALLPRLARQGVAPIVLTRRYADWSPSAMVANTPVCRVPAPGNRAVASLAFTTNALVWLWRNRRNVDVIHAYDLRSPTTTAVLAKLLLRRRVAVKVLRGGALGDLRELRQGMLGTLRLRLFAWLVDTFVVISSEIASELCAAGIPPSRIERIPNGVDTERFQPLPAPQRAALRAELGMGSAPVVFFAGRIETEKGLDVLLDAWCTVRARVPNARLLVAGDGTQRAALQARAVPGVQFLGTLEDPAPLLRAVDAFVLPSYSEGLSNALLEAMAAGLPCVATMVGGSVDLITPGKDGWLVPPGEREPLAKALIDALQPGRRETIGAAARALVEREYALASTADRLAALYRRLGSRPGGHRA